MIPSQNALGQVVSSHFFYAIDIPIYNNLATSYTIHCNVKLKIFYSKVDVLCLSLQPCHAPEHSHRKSSNITHLKQTMKLNHFTFFLMRKWMSIQTQNTLPKILRFTWPTMSHALTSLLIGCSYSQSMLNLCSGL